MFTNHSPLLLRNDLRPLCLHLNPIQQPLPSPPPIQLKFLKLYWKSPRTRSSIRRCSLILHWNSITRVYKYKWTTRLNQIRRRAKEWQEHSHESRLSASGPSFEAKMQQHRILSEKWDDVVDKIRQIGGFNNFFTSCTICYPSNSCCWGSDYHYQH